MDAASRPALLPPPLVALCGWIFPGLGYLLIGQRVRAIVGGGTVLLTFVLGLLIGGIRVIDVPGYDAAGQAKMVRINSAGDEAWALKADFKAEVLNKPWYIAQTLVGPVNIAATWGSLAAADTHRMSTARVFDIGTLYTAVAGMLNLLIIMDATYRATRPPEPEFEPAPPPPGDRVTGPDLQDAAAITAATNADRQGPLDESTGGVA